MGWGSLHIPGSNDGLVLAGMALRLRHAWIAFATMGTSIALALRLHKAWSGRGRGARPEG